MSSHSARNNSFVLAHIDATTSEDDLKVWARSFRGDDPPELVSYFLSRRWIPVRQDNDGVAELRIEVESNVDPGAGAALIDDSSAAQSSVEKTVGVLLIGRGTEGLDLRSAEHTS